MSPTVHVIDPKKLKRRKVIRRVILGVLIALALAFAYFFVGGMPAPASITWGINFSQRHTMNFGLDWKAAYTAMLDDLKVKHVKVLADWDLQEPTQHSFTFDDLSFQLGEAEKRGASVITVIGMKTGRWPECHLPEWAKGESKEGQQADVLELLTAVVHRFKSSPALLAWQVENEPMFVFGDCPWYDASFLAKEVALVRQLDPTHPVIVTDTGEGSLWWKAATLGDIVGTTLYRTVWFNELNSYVDYPIPAAFYGRKAALEGLLFGKPVWNVELQAEPWGKTLLYDLPLPEQAKTMTPEKFAAVVDYAEHTGLDTFYLWGAEWWYWMKEKHADPGMWEAAKTVFQGK